MRKILLALAVVALIGGGVAIAASSGGGTLPLDPSRADCPGMIECPLTGELVCADRCPLRAEGAAPAPAETEPERPCCRKGR